MTPYNFRQTYLPADPKETNKKPINAATLDPIGQAGFPQQGQTENVEYVTLIINHHRRKEERYIVLNALFIIFFFIHVQFKNSYKILFL
jgi:hypothetical protein